MAPPHLPDLMKKVEDASCRAQICRRQCEVLVEAFRTVSDHQCVQEMFQGIKLLGSCKMEGWIVRTLLRVESHWEFREIHRFLAVHAPEVLDKAAREDREHLSQIAEQEQVSFRPDEEFAVAMAKLLLHESRLRFDEQGLPIDFLIGNDLPQRKPKFIANGTSGVVYGVRWLDHEFAIKRIQNFSHKQELRVLPMKHPNVLSIVGYCYHEEGNSYSIVMERLATSLECLVKKRFKKSLLQTPRKFIPFEESVLVWIMLQIAQGMEFLHWQRLLHLDLKPANILVVDDRCKDAELLVKIGDFGSSIMLDELDLETEERNPKEGTPGYRAPDVRYSKKVDVFSYAMTCYELMSGERPFGGKDEAVWSGRDVRPGLPLDCRPDIGILVARCWSQNPDDRPEFSEIVRELHEIRSSLRASYRNGIIPK